jgi:two-component system cell cycle response regulator DivK
MSLVENARAPLDVLIAEDDGDVRLAVRQLLEGQGYTCAEAEDGRAAVEVARESPPRLVLLDLMMPEVDGFAAARRLRADPRTQDVTIHCLTALNFPAARQAAREAGCDGFLAKPFSPDELIGAVRAVIYSLRPTDDALTQARERLGQTLAAPVPGRERPWSRQLAGALADLESALRRPPDSRGFDLCRPTLVRRAAALRGERNRLLEQAHALRTQVRCAAEALPETDFTTLRRAGEQLLTVCLRHAEKERDVLFESLNTDIGVGD